MGRGFNSSINISRNGGKTWEYVNKSAYSLLIDLQDNVFLWYYIGSHKSIDGGYTWNPVNLPAMWAMTSAVDSNNYIFVGDNPGAVKSIDGGNNWVEILSDRYDLIRDIAIDKNNNHIYAAVDFYRTDEHVLLKSIDGGETWKIAFVTPGYVTDIAVDSKGSVYVGINLFGNQHPAGLSYFFKSTDGGETWEEVGR